MEGKLGVALPPGLDRRPARKAWKLVAAALLAFLAVASFTNGSRPWNLTAFPESPMPQDEDPSWNNIKPSRSLEWQTCFNGSYDCARLDVPMDWLDPTDDQRVILAVIRLPAVNRTDYRGPVFFNPGGPGGSGIWSLLDHGELLQTIVGDNHDIVTFDPRGIGASVPRIECWNTVQSRQLWDLQEVGLIDSHPGMLYDAFARAVAFSQICEANSGGASGILRHSSTTYHARDMLEILNQMGEEKLKFWGFSYGTILGGTFASMYPDKIERLVSDGNVDYKEWYYGSYINFLHDTDQVMEAFYSYCHLAGPLTCAFYAESPTAIKGRLDALLAKAKVNPVIIAASDLGPEMPEIVSYSMVKQMISTVLYQPVLMFQRMAEILAALERGDGRPFYEYRLAGSTPSTLCSLETVPPTIPMPRTEEGTADASPAIMCSDSGLVAYTVEEFEEYANRLQDMSAATGAVGAMARLSCVGRTVLPKWRFGGPFGGNTSFPILFVANIADNVTPLISARNNSASFPGSALLVQNSYGHTSLSAASSCTARYIRDYFQKGTLPATRGAICEADVQPFGMAASLDTEAGLDVDADLAWAVRKLSQKARWGAMLRPPFL